MDSTSKNTTLPESARGTCFMNPDSWSWVCPTCTEPFEIQIHMCKNGHLLCRRCCVTLNWRCPTYNKPNNDIRCRPMEKLLAAMTAPCKFKKQGCTHKIRLCEMRSHEETCRYATCYCPFDGCGASIPNGVPDYSSIYKHIILLHKPELVSLECWSLCTTVTLPKSVPFRSLIRPVDKTVFLLINGGDVPMGRSLSVVHITDRNTAAWVEHEETKFKIKVKSKELGSVSLVASGNAPVIRRLERFKSKSFLFVPDECWGSSGSISVTVTVYT